MSAAAVRAALETALNAMTPPIATAWENVDYKPTVGTAYQRATLLLAEPANPEIGPGYIEQGIFQVDLYYPKNSGPSTATARAEAIRNAFPFAASFTSGGITTHIVRTPEIGTARVEDDRYVIPVRIRFEARIAGG